MTKKPKILFYDIETRPILFYGWRTGNQDVHHHQIKKGENTDIICIGYKFLGQKSQILKWTGDQDSGPMIEKFSEILKKADLVIGHNGDKFDMKHINTARLLAGQPPLQWPTTEDTLKQIRKHFALPSYRLDYISKLLLGEGKNEMVFQDWIDIVENNCPKAMKKMLKYCKQDVELLERAWKKLSPYMESKVRWNDGDPFECRRCYKRAVKSGTAARKGGRKQRFQCTNPECGHVWVDDRRGALYAEAT